MDIFEIKTSNLEVELKHPGTEAPLGIHIDLYPLDHPNVKAVERRISNKVMKLRAKGKTLTADEVEENGIELLASAFAGWRWEADEDRGVEQPSFEGDDSPQMSIANVKKMLAKEWVRKQVDEKLGNYADFFTG